MSFRDHLFPSSTPTFPTADQVQDYLVSYADRFGLREHIRFDTTVIRLCKVDGSWTIEIKHAERGTEVSHWDNVVIANGHYADVHIPSIPGLS
jgi:cation diffusion facilitator CzcD-associated flavoprotein CzcO